MHRTRPNLRQALLSGLLVTSALANPYGLGDDNGGGNAPPPEVSDVVTWLPSTYFTGPAPGTQDWVGVQRAVEGQTVLPENKRISSVCLDMPVFV